MNERYDELVDTVALYHEKFVRTDKFTDEDVVNEPELVDYALEYLALYEGDFAYILDLKSRSRGSLSTGQARGVLNTMLAEKKRADHPIVRLPIMGLLSNGFYLMPGHPELEVRPWRETGERMLRVHNTAENRWDAFLTIFPDQTYQIWGRTNTEYLRELAGRFFAATNKDRTLWQEEWSLMSGKCYLDGTNPRTEPTGLCEKCATGQWAQGVVAEHVTTRAEREHAGVAGTDTPPLGE